MPRDARDRLDELGGILLAEHPRLVVGAQVQRAKLLDGQPEQIQGAAGQLALNELVRDDVTEALDVERGAGGKMLEPLRRLRGALQC